MLTISGQALGRRKPLFADFDVPPPVGVEVGRPTTLRTILEHIVHSEVAAFHTRQKRRQLLQVLSKQQVDDGLAAGKVDLGGREAPVQTVDAAGAIQTAIEAFQDGLYLVVLNGDEVKELDSEFMLPVDSRLAFVRLTMLAGG